MARPHSPTEAELLTLIQHFQDTDIVIAGSDYDDEAATGHLLGRFSAKQYIVADLIGPIRRKIGLPTRPLQTVLATAPPHTHALQEGAFLQL